MATTQQTDLIEILEGLLAAEGGDAFAFLAEADPYLPREAAHLRKHIDPIIVASRQRQAELAQLLDELGATPRGPAFSADNQYLAFLSMSFLLAKLIEAKQNSIRRYEAALAVADQSHAMIAEILTRHLAQHRQELEDLKAAGTLATTSGN